MLARYVAHPIIIVTAGCEYYDYFWQLARSPLPALLHRSSLRCGR